MTNALARLNAVATGAELEREIARERIDDDIANLALMRGLIAGMECDLKRLRNMNDKSVGRALADCLADHLSLMRGMVTTAQVKMECDRGRI